MSVRSAAPLPLTLTMLAWPEGTKPETREITRRCRIGRASSHSDWVLPDPLNIVSRVHCEILPVGDSWRVVDRSQNGTFVNDEAAQIGKNQMRELRDGDNLRLGGYVIEVRASLASQIDPQRSPDVQPVGGAHALSSASGPASAELPAGAVWGDDWSQPREASLKPRGLHDEVSWSQPVAGQPFPGGSDLDRGLPLHDAWTPPVPLDRRHDRGDADGPTGSAGLGADWHLEKGAPTPEVGRSEHRPSVPPASHSSDDARRNDDDLMAAFLRGARIESFVLTDPSRTMEQVGAALRALVAGLLEVRSSRAAVKREFRIAETTYATPNVGNPLRVIRSEDEALRTLLGGRVEPAQAIEDVLKRARLHELALVAAMRDGVAGLLDALSPAQVSTTENTPILGGLRSDRRKARAWDAYVALHAKTTEALLDDFDSVFGKAFARAYERVVGHVDGDPDKAARDGADQKRARRGAPTQAPSEKGDRGR